MLRAIGLTLLSAFLLILAFPKPQLWPLAWVALVPFLLAIDSRRFCSAGFLGLLFGFLFFFLNIGWLIYVTVPGAIVLSLYLAFYPALFALGVVYFKYLPLIPRVFILSALWAVLEFLRANLFTGFGWLTLGHSQYQNLLLIQIADIVGVYGISFLMMAVNILTFEIIRFVIAREHGDRSNLDEIASQRTLAMTQLKNIYITSAIITTLLVVSLAYGVWAFTQSKFSSTVQVGVIQPNIAQAIKWDERYMPAIMKQNLRLTDQVAQTKLDVILWPETALPGVVGEEPGYLEQIQLKALDLKTPIVMGAIDIQNDHYYNSAFLIGSEGKIKGRYKKIHLVPFGEFLPLRPVLGWLNKYIGLEDFTSGTEYTLFPAGVLEHKFGVLICFEDTINDLWRNFVNSGAGFLMNMTNDAWFMDTKEPFLHLQTAVLECVMNKRSLVRAANTGVSGFIDPLGRIMNLAEDKNGKKTFVEAVSSASIPVNDRITFYTKYADVFTSLCFLCILGAVFIPRRAYV
ncbi:MAG: apolipoprotein N-acyltransferase [Candidatus Omnitrophica bacterium]|nr:apolipoprotein N-acyltransferase [Candidatus Omnitrophota bacterium]